MADPPDAHDIGAQVLTHSADARKYLGTRESKHTSAATKTSMRAWFRTMFDAEAAGVQPSEMSEMDWIWSKMVSNVLHGYTGAAELNDLQLKNLNVSLCHFVVSLRKIDGGYVTPSTLNGYLDGISRFIEDRGINVDIRKNKIFIHKKDGYMTALENIIKQEQAKGVH